MLAQQLVSNTLTVFRKGVNDARSTLSVEGIRSLYRVSLYRNAFYLLLHLGSSAVLGFGFWIVVARLYVPDDVGLAAAAIAAASLMALLGNLGLGSGLIRFVSNAGSQGNSLINSCFSLGALASMGAALVFLGGLSLWAPSLLFLLETPVFAITFVAFAGSFNLIGMAGNALVANRRADLTLASSLIHGLLRLPLVILLGLVFRVYGIFAAATVGIVGALLVALFLFLPRVQLAYRPWFTIDRELIRKVMPFSMANYAGHLLSMGPGFVLPIIIVNMVGAEANAYFYGAWLIGTLLFAVGNAASLSLFAEGSSDEMNLGVYLRQSLGMSFVIVMPAVLVVLVLADKLLLLFGSGYSENATALLRILAISALPTVINNAYLGAKRVEKKLTVIAGLSSVPAAGIVALTYLLVPVVGITGVGIAYLASHGTITSVIVANWLRKGWAPSWLSLSSVPSREGGT
jgi:O-antigen/teichoic acid export membrane protein